MKHLEFFDLYGLNMSMIQKKNKSVLGGACSVLVISIWVVFLITRIMMLFDNKAFTMSFISLNEDEISNYHNLLKNELKFEFKFISNDNVELNYESEIKSKYLYIENHQSNFQIIKCTSNQKCGNYKGATET